MLIASTPEGARDFVVPSRLSPGEFYALPQSPQLFKQMCMVGGIDRYFQIARCLARRGPARRSPVRVHAARRRGRIRRSGRGARVHLGGGRRRDRGRRRRATDGVPRITWLEAQERYGSDKPDARFGMELVELTPVFAETEFKAFRATGRRRPAGFRGQGHSGTGRRVVARVDSSTT